MKYMEKELKNRIQQLSSLIADGFYKSETEENEAEEKIMRLQVLLEDLTCN
jgi:hypothetical protein